VSYGHQLRDDQLILSDVETRCYAETKWSMCSPEFGLRDGA
jgi:hypothetical protein